MTLSSLGYLAWPSPLLDPDLAVDPFVGARVAGDRLMLTLDSGAEVDAHVTQPAAGVLRIVIGGAARSDSPMLIDVANEAAVLRDTDDGVVAIGSGIEARWGADGSFVAGAATRAGADSGVRAGRVTIRGNAAGWQEAISLAPDAGIYGSGESPHGPNIRGRIRRIANAETHGMASLDWTYLNVPFFWSDAGWGLFFHTGGVMRADLGATHGEVAAFAVEDAVLDLFILAGTSPREVIDRYLRLTGRPGAFPSWALGVWTSRCSYLSEAEIREVVQGYRAADCPVDVVHVDAWVSGNVIADLACNWTVDRDRFPEGWARRLADEGIRTSLWHNPYVIADSPRARELAGGGLLAVDAGGELVTTRDKADRNVIDFTNPQAVEWWKARVRETIEGEGNAAFKPDFGEELPEHAVLHDGRTGRQARNEYALLYQRATAEAMQGALGEEAVALFCRSGTAGAQRYPCHWVGDTPSTWPGLVSALRSCLSLSLSGFGFVAADIGGFWTGGSHGWVKEAFDVMDNADIPADVEPELFLRWTQWGALSPVMRFHGTGRREPWAYPSPWREPAVEACRLRHRLLPYLEASANETARTGVPMMRPMVLAYPDEPEAPAAALQYLLGPDILVSPLLTPGGSATVWLPPGEWEPLLAPGGDQRGSRWIRVTCGLEEYPAWIRKGMPV